MFDKINQSFEHNPRYDESKIARVGGICLASVASIEVIARATDLLADIIHHQKVWEHALELGAGSVFVAGGLVASSYGVEVLDRFIDRQIT